MFSHFFHIFFVVSDFLTFDISFTFHISFVASNFFTFYMFSHFFHISYFLCCIWLFHIFIRLSAILSNIVFHLIHAAFLNDLSIQCFVIVLCLFCIWWYFLFWPHMILSFSSYSSHVYITLIGCLFSLSLFVNKSPEN